MTDHAVPDSGVNAGSRRLAARISWLFSHQSSGPLLATIVAVVFFSVTTSTFFNSTNLSLILQQTVVTGTLAIGQTLIILTAGIDLANSATMVLGMVVIGQIALTGNWPIALLLGLVLCAGIGAVSGSIVAWLKLPPFIVTLGMLGILTAAAQLFTHSASIPIVPGPLTVLGSGPSVGGTTVFSYGTIVWILMTIVVAYALRKTAWGAHIYAIGNSESAAKLNGVKVTKVLLSVYIVAGIIFAIAAWQAFGRTPVADPSAYATANLDSITAVVIGGTSLFGGRGGVVGTLIGSLIVTVLQNGLVQMGIDSLYQQVATGILVIIAVLIDQISRRRRS